MALMTAKEYIDSLRTSPSTSSRRDAASSASGRS